MKTILFTGLSFLLAAGLATSATATSSDSTTLKSVLDQYMNIQNALARDSMENVSANAHALAELVRADQSGSVPADVAEQAAKLADARRLGKARQAFKALSDSLIASLKACPTPPATYYEFYCPTCKASWLQTSKKSMNPYLGLRAETPTWGWAGSSVEKAEFAGR